MGVKCTKHRSYNLEKYEKELEKKIQIQQLERAISITSLTDKDIYDDPRSPVLHPKRHPPPRGSISSIPEEPEQSNEENEEVYDATTHNYQNQPHSSKTGGSKKASTIGARRDAITEALKKPTNIVHEAKESNSQDNQAFENDNNLGETSEIPTSELKSCKTSSESRKKGDQVSIGPLGEEVIQEMEKWFANNNEANRPQHDECHEEVDEDSYEYDDQYSYRDFVVVSENFNEVLLDEKLANEHEQNHYDDNHYAKERLRLKTNSLGDSFDKSNQRLDQQSQEVFSNVNKSGTMSADYISNYTKGTNVRNQMLNESEYISAEKESPIFTNRLDVKYEDINPQHFRDRDNKIGSRDCEASKHTTEGEFDNRLYLRDEIDKKSKESQEYRTDIQIVQHDDRQSAIESNLERIHLRTTTQREIAYKNLNEKTDKKGELEIGKNYVSNENLERIYKESNANETEIESSDHEDRQVYFATSKEDDVKHIHQLLDYERDNKLLLFENSSVFTSEFLEKERQGCLMLESEQIGAVKGFSNAELISNFTENINTNSTITPIVLAKTDTENLQISEYDPEELKKIETETSNAEGKPQGQFLNTDADDDDDDEEFYDAYSFSDAPDNVFRMNLANSFSENELQEDDLLEDSTESRNKVKSRVSEDVILHEAASVVDLMIDGKPRSSIKHTNSNVSIDFNARECTITVPEATSSKCDPVILDNSIDLIFFNNVTDNNSPEEKLEAPNKIALHLMNGIEEHGEILKLLNEEYVPPVEMKPDIVTYTKGAHHGNYKEHKLQYEENLLAAENLEENVENHNEDYEREEELETIGKSKTGGEFQEASTNNTQLLIQFDDFEDKVLAEADLEKPKRILQSATKTNGVWENEIKIKTELTEKVQENLRDHSVLIKFINAERIDSLNDSGDIVGNFETRQQNESRTDNNSEEEETINTKEGKPLLEDVKIDSNECKNNLEEIMQFKQTHCLVECKENTAGSYQTKEQMQPQIISELREEENMQQPNACQRPNLSNTLVVKTLARMEHILGAIGEIKSQIEKFKGSRTDDMYLEVYDRLIKIMKDINRVYNFDYDGKIIEMQQNALNEVQKCMSDLELKVTD